MTHILLKPEERFIIRQEMEIQILKGNLSLFKMNVSSDFEKVDDLKEGEKYNLKNDRIFIIFNEGNTTCEFIY